MADTRAPKEPKEPKDAAESSEPNAPKAAKSIPQSRLGRLARYAGLGARTGASLLLSRGKGKGAGAAAARAAEVLGTMRGLAAKIGQMASYVDGMVPDAHREAYEKALGTLRTAAYTSAPDAIRRVVEEDLGAPVSELFADWEDAPFASASIGQVHRATLGDGRAVAVKVQHPGVARAVESDLRNAGLFQGMASAFMPKKMSPKEVFTEIEARFREELDYRLEAERQEHFRALHAADPKIRIPAVVRERSGPRVLTTVMAHGKSLEEACLASEPVRRGYAETLWRFVFKGNLVGRLFNADPHPGNYLFADDGTITFLDFGCCQPISEERQEEALAAHRAALRGEEAEFKRAITVMLRTRGGKFEEMITAYMRSCFEPIFASPFLVTSAYVKQLLSSIVNLKEAVLAGDKSFTALPPGSLFMNRLQFGFYSVLAKLNVEVDYASVERTFLGEAGLLEPRA